MKKLIFIACICSLTTLLSAQQLTYSRVKIILDNKTPAQLFATGIDIVQAGPSLEWFTAEISQDEISRLATEGFHVDIIIPDMTKYYNERQLEKSAYSETDKQMNEEWPQPVNFSLGSCGGFSTVDQMIAQLDLMRALYPNLVSIKQPLSDSLTTIEGRTIYYVRISDNPDVNEAEPEVLYTGMHHAREPIGMQHLLYYMWYLLENYNSNSSIKGLVDSTEMYFVPVFNVDGYTYNITTNANGGGMWRKNRRDNGDGSFGIDINRNYGYKWGFDDSGSSPVTSSDLYRGTSAFSEPETRMMKYFCESHDFRIALNYHSYSNLFLYAWGWSDFPTPDNDVFDAFANLMTKDNNYTYGPGNTTIYPTNGGSDDWMYGEQLTKPAILAYTPEIGNSSDGFWPVQSRILPLIQENMLASLTAARLAGKYGIIRDASPLFINEQSGNLTFEVKRLGMQEGDFTVSVLPLDNSFISLGDSKIIQGMTLLEKRIDSISYELANTLQVGDTIHYLLTIDNGYFTEQDTVMRIFGYPYSVFSDNLDNKNNWTGTWAITTEDYYSPASSMTDSPNGNYSAGANKSIALINEINLPNTLLMVLEFRAKWALEKDYDYVQVSISVNNGATWVPLSGKYTRPGTSNQVPGQPLYDGKEGDWLREAISLNDYMGKKVKFRFRLKADQGSEQDGFYFDDFNISMLLDPTLLSEIDPLKFLLGLPYPNPSTSGFKVSYALPDTKSNANLVITTASGTEVSKTRLSEQQGLADIDIRFLSPGIYFMRVESDIFQSQVRKLIIKK